VGGSVVDLADRVIRIAGSFSAMLFVPYEEAFEEGFENCLAGARLLQDHEETGGDRREARALSSSRWWS
jgi:hypothetical protein